MNRERVKEIVSHIRHAKRYGQNILNSSCPVQELLTIKISAALGQHCTCGLHDVWWDLIDTTSPPRIQHRKIVAMILWKFAAHAEACAREKPSSQCDCGLESLIGYLDPDETYTFRHNNDNGN